MIFGDSSENGCLAQVSEVHKLGLLLRVDLGEDTASAATFIQEMVRSLSPSILCEPSSVPRWSAGASSRALVSRPGVGPRV